MSYTTHFGRAEDEKGGVVDERLNVYGVEGLKVAGTCYVTIVGSSSQHAHGVWQICQFVLGTLAR